MMTLRDIEAGLERIANSEYFELDAYRLVDEWTVAGVGIEAVEPILRFMERDPDVDLGTPGPLVHFVEEFYGKGYEDRLFASLKRKPTGHTLWMLNRVINDTHEPTAHAGLIAMLEAARVHPDADAYARKRAEEYCEYHTRDR